MKEKEKMKNEI